LKNNGGSYRKAVFPSIFSGLLKADAEADGKITSEEFTLLPLRELVLYPNTVVPIFITVQPGISALEEALRRDNRLFAFLPPA